MNKYEVVVNGAVILEISAVSFIQAKEIAQGAEIGKLYSNDCFYVYPVIYCEECRVKIPFDSKHYDAEFPMCYVCTAKE